jgi:hypothetical protein
MGSEPRYFDINPFKIASTKANDMVWSHAKRRLGDGKLGSTTGGWRLIHMACADDPACKEASPLLETSKALLC